MKKIFIVLTILTVFVLFSCETEFSNPIPIPNDITLNELDESLGVFNHTIPSGGFQSDVATFNTVTNSDGSYSGFAYSNRNYRSYTWTTSQTALDSMIYSVYTKYVNQTKTYAVACVKNDDAFITFDKAYVVEHILVANTTYSYLAVYYGDPYGTDASPKQNPNIVATAKGVWHLNTDGARKLSDVGDYLKIIVKGYNNNNLQGELEFYLQSNQVDPDFPDKSYTINDWYRWDLYELGEVDKLVFSLESSDVDDITGEMKTPPYFCLDGIRLRR